MGGQLAGEPWTSWSGCGRPFCVVDAWEALTLVASGSAVIFEACGRDFMGGGPGVKKGRLAYLHTYTARHNTQEPPTKLVLVSATSFFSHARDMELYLGKRHRYQFCAQGEYIITLVTVAGI